MRENALCAMAAGGASLAMGWLGLYGFGWNDYEVEVLPSLNALTRGNVLEFLRLAPAYGGSLIERAPFALLPGLWGGGQLAVYRAVAAPCLLSAVVLAVWLCSRLRAARMPALWRAVAVGVCVANPITLAALEEGHPEELLGACLCVGAVLVAMRGRAVWAGVLLGLAIANKEWALLAVGPVLLALPPTRAIGETGKWRRNHPVIACTAAAGAVTALVLAPPALVSGGGFVASTRAVATTPGDLFQPWQVWWFFGWHGPVVHREFNTIMHGYRTGPAWASTISHPLIVLVGFALAGVLWAQSRRRSHPVRARDALLLLALVLLARCVLDTWDIGYYMLPCSIAVMAWETLGARRAPILALAGVIAPWLLLEQVSEHGATPDVQSALFLAWTLPLTAYLALRLYAPEARIRIRPPAHVRARRPQEITVSSVGSPVSTS